MLLFEGLLREELELLLDRFAICGGFPQSILSRVALGAGRRHLGMRFDEALLGSGDLSAQICLGRAFLGHLRAQLRCFFTGLARLRAGRRYVEPRDEEPAHHADEEGDECDEDVHESSLAGTTDNSRAQGSVPHG